MQQALKRLGDFIAPKLPHILTGVGVIGVGGTAVLTGLAVPKAQEKIAEEMVRRSDISGEPIEELTFLEKAQATWICFVPAMICGAATSACIIGSNRMQASSLAAATMGGIIFERAYDDLKDGVIEKMGADAYDGVMSHVAQKKVEAIDHFPTEEELAEYGVSELYFDDETKTLLRTSRGHLLDVEKRVNQQLAGEGTFVSWNDILELIGEDTRDPGEFLGVTYELDGWFEFEIFPGERNGVLCWVFDYHPKPRPRYYGG